MERMARSGSVPGPTHARSREWSWKQTFAKFEVVQLGQPSVSPPRLVLEVGGTSTLQAAMPVKLKSPPHFKVPSGGDFSSPGMAAC